MGNESMLPPFIFTDIGTSIDDSPAEDAGSTSELMCRNELKRDLRTIVSFVVIIPRKASSAGWIQLQSVSVLRFDVY